MMKIYIGIVAASLLFWSGSAKAQLSSAEATPPLLTSHGESFVLSGGVTNFIEGSARNATDVGGFWEARLGFGTRSWLGAEAAYVGSARKIRDGRLDTTLVGNGIEGNLRVNYPYTTGAWLIEPFAFGGLGWTHFSVNGLERDTLTLRSHDDLLTVPLGGGIAATYRHVLLEGRFTYRQTFNDSLIGRGDGQLKSWAAGASAGYEF